MYNPGALLSGLYNGKKIMVTQQSFLLKEPFIILPKCRLLKIPRFSDFQQVFHI
eukprot:UN23651